VAPSVYLTAAGDDAARRAGEPLELRLASSLDAFVTCWHEQADGVAMPLPIERVTAGQPLLGSTGYALRLAAAKGGERERVACVAATMPIEPAVPGGARLADLEAKAAKTDGYLASGELTLRTLE
jgi:hypothetical protein